MQEQRAKSRFLKLSMQPRSQSSLASFDVTSSLKLLGRALLWDLAITENPKWRSEAKRPTSAKNNGNHISFLPSTMILKCSEGMYVTYTSEIFPDPRSKKKVFIEQCLGLFLAELGLFCHFVSGLLAIALGSRPHPLTRIAGIGLRTRLPSMFWNFFNNSNQ